MHQSHLSLAFHPTRPQICQRPEQHCFFPWRKLQHNTNKKAKAHVAFGVALGERIGYEKACVLVNAPGLGPLWVQFPAILLQRRMLEMLESSAENLLCTSQYTACLDYSLSHGRHSNSRGRKWDPAEGIGILQKLRKNSQNVNRQIWLHNVA